MTYFRYRFLIVATTIAIGSSSGLGDELPHLVHEPAQMTGRLQCSEVHESSGIAISRAQDGTFWTHNDSGDRPRLFAFRYDGSHLGTWDVKGAQAHDWEDMASFTRNEQPLLLIADTGDNLKRRNLYHLYVVGDVQTEKGPLQLLQTIPFRFETGSHDCEAVAYDPQHDQIILITKGWEPSCEVHVLQWPEQQNGGEHVTTTVIAKLHIAGITGVDISPDGKFAVVVTYGNAYVFARTDHETWSEGFSRPGQKISLPARKQGESICFADDGCSLLLTSEKLPTPVFHLKGRETPSAE